MKTNEPHQRMLRWVLLGAICAVYTFSVLRIDSAAFFGLSEDDAIYFSSAKALAEGRGYVLPSVPGEPAATKYPVLYPWLLSWIWKWGPAFPVNLRVAIALNIVFGWAFIAGAFHFFKDFGSVSDGWALMLSAFCGLHPLVVLHTANVLTEIPFAAMALWAMVIAGRAVKAEARASLTIICGFFCGAALLTRLIGLTLAAGLCLTFLYWNGLRRSVAFVVGLSPFLAILVWTSVMKRVVAAPSIADADCASVWQMSWMYYTSYISYWRADAIGLHALWGMVKQNLLLLGIQPGVYFLDPQVLKPSGAVIIAAVLVSVAVWKRLIFKLRETLAPIHFAFAVYLIPVIFWDYPLVERFLIPFIPLLVMALWLEVTSVVGLIQRTFSGAAKDQKPAAVFLATIVCAFAISSGVSFRNGTVGYLQKSKIRAEMLREKRMAYEWLVVNTTGDDVVVAYEDASLYLYTGRQSFRPVILSPAGGFSPGQERAEQECVGVSAKALHARYWLISEDDFGMEPGKAAEMARAQERKLGAVSLFHSGDSGRVEIVRLEASETSR